MLDVQIRFVRRAVDGTVVRVACVACEFDMCVILLRLTGRPASLSSAVNATEFKSSVTRVRISSPVRVER